MASEELIASAALAEIATANSLELEDVENALAGVMAAMSTMADGRPFRRSTVMLRPYAARPGMPGFDAREIPMPDPVDSVKTVTVDGVEFADWRAFFEAGVMRLVRIDGQPWPTSQDRFAVPSWFVTAIVGETPSYLAQQAALELLNAVLELGAQACGGFRPGVVQQTVEGMTVQYDPDEAPEERMIATARWLSVVNPNKRPQAGMYVPGGAWEFIFEDSDVPVV
ncbi:MAG: hypothetical protein KDB37_14255 [Ilumatobacter sp.]|nr:hypothetical protein [Ilumatobacter sp.]